MNPGFLPPAAALAYRELVRFFRQPSRVFGAFATPLLFWLVMGSGLGDSFQPREGQPGYLHYLFPGTVLLIVLFSSIFSAMTLIEDRREGFLQSVLVSPAPRASLVLGKVSGGAGVASFQGLLFVLLAPLAGFSLRASSLALLAAFLFLVAFGLTALGFSIAWRIDSIQGYHAVMNLLLVPMWLLSGSVFPSSGAAPPLRVLMNANPLTYGAAGLRRLLAAEGSLQLPRLGPSVLVVLLFSVGIFAAALAGARSRRP